MLQRTHLGAPQCAHSGGLLLLLLLLLLLRRLRQLRRRGSFGLQRPWAATPSLRGENAMARVPDDVAAALAAALRERVADDDAHGGAGGGGAAAAGTLAAAGARRLAFDGASTVAIAGEIAALAESVDAAEGADLPHGLRLDARCLDNVVAGAARGANDGASIEKRAAFARLAAALLVRRTLRLIRIDSDAALAAAVEGFELDDHDGAADEGEPDASAASAFEAEPLERVDAFAEQSDDDDYEFEPMDGPMPPTAAMSALSVRVGSTEESSTGASWPALLAKLVALLGAARVALAEAPLSAWPAAIAASDIAALLRAAHTHRHEADGAAAQLGAGALALARDRALASPRDTAALLPEVMRALPEGSPSAVWLLAELARVASANDARDARARGGGDGGGESMRAQRSALWPHLRDALPATVCAGETNGPAAAEVVRAFAAFSAAGADVRGALLKSGAFRAATLAAAAAAAAGDPATAKPALDAVWTAAAADPSLAAWAGAVKPFKQALADSKALVSDAGALSEYGVAWGMFAAEHSCIDADVRIAHGRAAALVGGAAERVRVVCSACAAGDCSGAEGAADGAVSAAARAGDFLRLLAACCAAAGGARRACYYRAELHGECMALRAALRDLPSAPEDDLKAPSPGPIAAGGAAQPAALTARSAPLAKLRELRPALLAVLRELADAGEDAPGAGKKD